MASLTVPTPDGKTLTVNVPEGTNPNSYGAMAEDALQHYTQQVTQLPQYATPAQKAQYPASSATAEGVGRGLEVLSSPFQAVGEAIRRPIDTLQGKDPGPYRIPTVLQRLATAMGHPQFNTQEQAPDMFSAMVNPAYAGLKGVAATTANMNPQALKDVVQSVRSGEPQASGDGLGNALQQGTQAIAQPPGLPEAALSMGAVVGSGEMGNIPFTAALKPFEGVLKLLETGHLAGIPASGMAAKAASGMDAVPLGLENLTAHANPETLSLAEKANVPLTPAGLTGSPTLAAIEGFLRKLPFSSNVMQERFTQQMSALSKVREPIVEASKPMADLGLDVQEGLTQATNTAMGKAQDLYSKAADAIPQGTQVPLEGLQAKAADLLRAQGKLPRGAQASDSVALLQDLSDPRAKYMDYQTLQSLRSEINSRIAQANPALKGPSGGASFQASPEIRIYSQLKDALDGDLNSFSDKTGGDFKSIYSEANKTYQTFKQTYKNDKFVQSILSEQNPENVVNKVVKAASDNPRALGTLKLNLPPQTLNDLQTYFIKNMTEKVPDEFSPTHFVDQYNRIGEKRLELILGPQKLAQLRPLYVLSKASKVAEALGASATGPSGAGVASAVGLTAPMMMGLREVAHGKPIEGLAMATAMLSAEMEGLPMLAKAYLSKPVGKLLTRQIELNPSFPTTSAISKNASKTAIPIQQLIKKLQDKYDARRRM